MAGAEGRRSRGREGGGRPAMGLGFGLGFGLGRSRGICTVVEGLPLAHLAHLAAWQLDQVDQGCCVCNIN